VACSCDRKVSYIPEIGDLEGGKKGLEVGRCKESVYMITVVKVAKDLSENCEDKAEKGGVVKVMADGTASRHSSEMFGHRQRFRARE
jgi:hypothetical protein